jgi:hypothetical protein
MIDRGSSALIMLRTATNGKYNKQSHVKEQNSNRATQALRGVMVELCQKSS